MSACASIMLTFMALGQTGDTASTDAVRPQTSINFSFDALLAQPPSSWLDEPERYTSVLGFGTQSQRQIALETRLRWEGDHEHPINLEMLSAERSLYESTGVRVGRSTALLDGGIDANASALGEDTMAGYLQESGEFDLYDISLAMRALGNNELALNFISGFRAIRAHVGQTTRSTDADGNTYDTLHKRRGVVAVPVIGTGFEWHPTRAFSLEGSATTHAVDSSGTFLDLSAEARIQFTHNVDFVTGFQYVRSVMEVRDIEAELADGGLFARLQIRF
jgi:hypothetical protein